MTDTDNSKSKIIQHLHGEAAELEIQLIDIFESIKICGNIRSIREELSDHGDKHIEHSILVESLQSYRDYDKQTMIAGLAATFYLTKLYKSLEEKNILASMKYAKKANQYTGRLAGARDSGYFDPEESKGSPDHHGRRPNNENEKIKRKVIELLERQAELGKKEKNLDEIFNLVIKDLSNFLDDQKISRPKATTIQRNTALWAKKDHVFKSQIEELIKKLRA